MPRWSKSISICLYLYDFTIYNRPISFFFFCVCVQFKAHISCLDVVLVYFSCRNIKNR